MWTGMVLQRGKAGGWIGRWSIAFSVLLISIKASLKWKKLSASSALSQLFGSEAVLPNYPASIWCYQHCQYNPHSVGRLAISLSFISLNWRLSSNPNAAGGVASYGPG